MAITSITALGSAPRLIRIACDDSYADITTLNYLDLAKAQGFEFVDTDVFEINYENGGYGTFQPTISGDNITLVAVPVPDTIFFTFDVACGQAALASGGSVTLFTSNGSEQYKIRALEINSGGTNFSGGSGNRLGQITDGTTVYSVIPAASLQTLANAGWGVTALPYPASAAINASTAPGADLVFKYSGGTTDYTAGSIVVSGTLERVA